MKRKENSEAYSVALFKKPKPNILSVDGLRKLHHDEVLEILRNDLFFSKKEIKQIEKPVDDDGDYPLNALNGNHLSNAVDEYNTNIKDKQSAREAKQSLITLLMNKEKITDDSVALSIANWLIKKVIEGNSNHEHSQEGELEQDKSITDDDIVEFVNTFILNIHGENPKVISHENVEGSSSIIVYGFGSNFTFVGREDVLRNYKSCYSQYFESMKDCSVIRDNIKFPFITSAPGIGKSRILKEIGISMYNEEKFFPLFVSFGNGTKMDLNLEKKPINSLCVRIIHSLICAFTGLRVKYLFLRIYYNNGITISKKGI